MGAAGRPELAAQRAIWRANLRGLGTGGIYNARYPSCTMVPSQVSRRATWLSANYRHRETYEMLLSLCGHPDTRDSGSLTSTYYGYRRPILYWVEIKIICDVCASGVKREAWICTHSMINCNVGVTCMWHSHRAKY